MTFEELPVPRFSCRIKPKDPKAALVAGDVLALRPGMLRGNFEIRTDKAMIPVVAVASADINHLASVITTGRAVLARLSDPAPDGSIQLSLAIFGGEMLEMGNLDVGVDDRLIVTVGKSRLTNPNLQDVVEALHKQSVLTHGGKEYFLLAAGGAAERYLELDEEGKKVNRAFAVVGAGYTYALAEKDKGSTETIFLANKFHRLKRNFEDSALRLARGRLNFLDWTAAGGRVLFVKQQLDQLLKNGGGYLQKWDLYGNTEGDLFLEKARRVGSIRFKVTNETKSGLATLQCLDLKEDQRVGLEAVDSVDMVGVEDLPAYLNDPEMTFSGFVSGVMVKATDENLYGSSVDGHKEHKKAQTFSVSEFNAATGELLVRNEDGAPFDETAYLILSVAGEVTQIKRRMNARLAIQNGRAVNPNLGAIIEDGARIPPSSPPPVIKPLTPFVKRKVFPKNPPTLAQERAIEIALNTPDIALIQGPPGTGKTTVIAAIIERLNEEFDKRGNLSGHVLLSGFQHDAVENMIDRLSINSLPVPKFGERSGAEKGLSFSRFERQMQDWCESRAKALREKNPQIEESLEERNIRDLCVQYIKAPTLTLAISLLERAIALPSVTIGDSLRKELTAELRDLKSEETSIREDNPWMPVVRGLRVTETGFADDGPNRAGDAWMALKDELDAKDVDLLKEASRWNLAGACPPFLSAMKDLKGRLLKRFTPAPVFRTEKSRDSVVRLIKKTIDAVRCHGMSNRDRRTAALSELLLELENDPAGIQDAVADYCFAFAATCQQSVNMQMQLLKGCRKDLPEDEPAMKYDYVIVDEAARVSPRDLMITMVQGKHIILVGDHRQLPQLIDEEVARRLETDDVSETESDWLSKSLFEYLFTERIAKLEEMDNRPRHITLDAQFRTHPTLGKFISRNFYERFNQDERFDSPLGEEVFAQNLPGTQGRCAVWLDVPPTSGRMTPSGASWTRPAEADAITAKLKEWIEYDDRQVAETGSKPLTFGVIAFYKAQVNVIRRRLGFSWLESVGEERVKIGTVDSFQGREFDVVFLSLVRSGVKGFGFLTLYNRLNVSMSRQKKLLVVAGDAEYYDTPRAREKVPGITAFLELCREKGVVL